MLTTVVISKEPHIEIEEEWRHRGYRIFWRVNDITVDPENTLDRVKAVAGERNEAMRDVMKVFPDTTDVFMLDSYYAPQYGSCWKLIRDYEACGGQMILGAAIWNRQRASASQIIVKKRQWHDTWGFPDCRFMPYGWKPSKDPVVWGRGAKTPMKDFYRVSCVGSAYIFPIEAYEKTQYRPCEDLSRTEHYHLCQNSGLPCYVDFNTPLFRDIPGYSISKCLRVTAGAWRRKLTGV